MSARIYALRNRTTDKVYIGSTKAYLSRRLAQHKYTCRNELPSSCDEIVLCPTVYIELIEECDVSIRYERERYWIENTPNCVNVRMPVITEQEKKENASQYNQEYYQTNKEQIRQHQKDYNNTHKEDIKQYNKNYYQLHKETIKAQTKAYKDRVRGSATTLS